MGPLFTILEVESVTSRYDNGTIRNGSGIFLYLISLCRVLLLIMPLCSAISILTRSKGAELKVKVKMFEILQYNVFK